MLLVLQKSNMSHWAKIKVLAGLHCFLEALGESLFCCFFFPLLEAIHISWLLEFFSTFKPEMSVKLFSYRINLTLMLLSPSFTYKETFDDISPLEVIQDTLLSQDL